MRVSRRHRLLDTLRRYIAPGHRFTVAGCERLATEKEPGPTGWAQYKRQELRDLMSVNGKINARVFGHLLRNYRDRILNGWRITLLSAKAHGGVNSGH